MLVVLCQGVGKPGHHPQMSRHLISGAPLAGRHFDLQSRSWFVRSATQTLINLLVGSLAQFIATQLNFRRKKALRAVKVDLAYGK